LSRYYFLVASLPALQYDVAPTVSSDRLRPLCDEHLTRADRDILRQARLDVWNGDGSLHPSLRRWYRWEISLRNSLARGRAHAKGADAEPYLRPVPSLSFENFGADTFECEALARSSLSAPNPLVAQDALDRARWALFDSLEFGHPFELDWLLAYALKLQLLERRAQASPERGLEALESIRAATVAKITAGEAFHE